MKVRLEKVGAGRAPKPTNLLSGITCDLVVLKKRAGYIFGMYLTSNLDTIATDFSGF